MMKQEKIVPTLNGYDELGELIELAFRLKRVFEDITWYMQRIEQRISDLMEPARMRCDC